MPVFNREGRVAGVTQVINKESGLPFDTEDVDPSKFAVSNMKGIKRSSRKRGRVLGHRCGIGSATLLSYQAARMQIYLPTYKFVLDTFLTREIAQLRTIPESCTDMGRRARELYEREFTRKAALEAWTTKLQSMVSMPTPSKPTTEAGD